MKKILITLSSLSGLTAFVLMLVTMLGGMRKTIIGSVKLTEEEQALISKLGNTKWTDYFFTILTLVVLLIAVIFITVVIFKGKCNFASASHIVALISMLMMFLCFDASVNGEKTALFYNNVLVITSLICTVLMYAFLLFYSAAAITADEFRRYL